MQSPSSDAIPMPAIRGHEESDLLQPPPCISSVSFLQFGEVLESSRGEGNVTVDLSLGKLDRGGKTKVNRHYFHAPSVLGLGPLARISVIGCYSSDALLNELVILELDAQKLF